MELRSDDLWEAIDALAEARGLSASGLAITAGLDPTAFNLSKRARRNGRSRWPSTETIAKLMAATGISFAEFAGLVDRARARRVPAETRGRATRSSGARAAKRRL